MVKVKDLTIDDLEYLIEQKVLEILGDPDSGLLRLLIQVFQKLLLFQGSRPETALLGVHLRTSKPSLANAT